MQHSARPESLRVCWILLARIVEFLRFLLGVEVVEVAEPLIEAMHRGQKLVTITQMILAELRHGIPDRLEHLRQGGIFLLNAAFRTRDADRGHTGPDRQLACDERRAASGTTRLGIVVREKNAFLRDSVDVGRAAHHAVSIGTDVPHADVIAHNDDNVGFFRLVCVLLRINNIRYGGQHQCESGRQPQRMALRTSTVLDRIFIAFLGLTAVSVEIL